MPKKKYTPEFHFQPRGDRKGIAVSINLPTRCQDTSLKTANKLFEKLKASIPFEYKINWGPNVMFPYDGKGAAMMAIQMSIVVPDIEEASDQLKQAGFVYWLPRPLLIR